MALIVGCLPRLRAGDATNMNCGTPHSSFCHTETLVSPREADPLNWLPSILPVPSCPAPRAGTYSLDALLLASFRSEPTHDQARLERTANDLGIFVRNRQPDEDLRTLAVDYPGSTTVRHHLNGGRLRGSRGRLSSATSGASGA